MLNTPDSLGVEFRLHQDQGRDPTGRFKHTTPPPRPATLLVWSEETLAVEVNEVGR